MTYEPLAERANPESPRDAAGDIEYRAIEPWAVGGLMLALASPLAMLGGLMTMVAVLAVLANVVALVRIKRDRGRTGRAAALAGLALSMLFAVAPAAQWGASYLLLAQQPRPMADQWFEFLRQGHPERAARLRLAPEMRPPLDDGLWLYFRHDDEAQEELRKFVLDPTVRTLLALGERAEVRFYGVGSVVADGKLGGVQYLYTVTYPDGEKKKTFLVSLLLERGPTKKPDVNPWRVKACFGVIDPNKRFR